METKNEDIKITSEDSSLAEFVKRPVPTDKEVEQFEDYMNEEAKEEELDESLSEIYQDDKGKMVDVKKLDIKKGRGFFFWFFIMIIFGGLAGAAAFYGYNYLKKVNTDPSALQFTIESNNELLVNEEFYYTINYSNSSNVNLKDAWIEVTYPDHFIFLDSTPEPSKDKNNNWEIGNIPAHSTGRLKVKGKIIGTKDETEIIFASLNYKQENYAIELKKESSFTSIVKDTGLDITIDNVGNSLVDEENEIVIRYNAKENNFMNNFRVTFEPQENIVITTKEAPKLEDGKPNPDISLLRPGVWQVNNIAKETKSLQIKFKFMEKQSENQDVKLIFEYNNGDNKFYKFLEQNLPYVVMKNDLNLALIINGSREDKGINFGDTLNYSVVYNNKGETDMKDVVLMAVIESDIVDWQSIKSDTPGKVSGNSISWTKNEIPALENIEKHQEGTIDFSLKVKDSAVIEQGKKYEAKSYVQFSVGSGGDKAAKEENKSNVITNKINSDLRLVEKVLYFSEDNIPVGTGPNPPSVGQDTTYKVYWQITNNLHELEDLKVKVKLPNNVYWDNRSQASVGQLYYSSTDNEIIWQIGRLPISVILASAEFSIKVIPQDQDRGKIMVVLSGSEISAVDNETGSEIKENVKAKTTKLEDDTIAESDGIVN